MPNPYCGTSGEFYVLSMLLRRQIDAHITLGNTKAIDIVAYSGGVRKTIDVKTTEYGTDFIMGSCRLRQQSTFITRLTDPDHYFVFVAYCNRIGDPKFLPECYVVPGRELMTVAQFTSGKNGDPAGDPKIALNAKMGKLRASGFLNGWDLI